MRALLSAYDKSGIVELASQLHRFGVELVASGGTARVIAKASIPVTDVAEITGFGAMLGHRVVTLHPSVHGGILADRDDPVHLADLEQYGIEPFDIMVGNIYPFTSDPSIELIDIGGPTMLRGAAKNFQHVTVVVDPSDYEELIGELRQSEYVGPLGTSLAFRRSLARKAFAHTAAYDAAIVDWFDEETYAAGELPATLHVAATLQQPLKYGENAWQKPSGLYVMSTADPLALDKFTLLEGNPGNNNWLDVSRALQTATHIAAGTALNLDQDYHIAVGVKHGNACGAAFEEDEITVLERMLKGNLTSIFGGYVLTNFVIDVGLAELLLQHGSGPAGRRRLLEGVVAPAITREAQELLHRKGDKCVMLENPALVALDATTLDTSRRRAAVRGGYIDQPNYTYVLDLYHSELEVGQTIEEDFTVIGNIVLAWAVGSTSTSNTIAITKYWSLLSSGVGQQDRVGAAKLALARYDDALEALREANLQQDSELPGATAYSDSFFPFRDGPLVLAAAGIETLFASRGSVKDPEVRAACEEAGVNLITLPDAICRGFYGHA